MRNISLQFGVSVNVSHLKYHSHVLWLNPTEEQLAKGWKKGQGPSMLCFGECKWSCILMILMKGSEARSGLTHKS